MKKEQLTEWSLTEKVYWMKKWMNEWMNHRMKILRDTSSQHIGNFIVHLENHEAFLKHKAKGLAQTDG